jgi:hypothetical protein
VPCGKSGGTQGKVEFPRFDTFPVTQRIVPTVTVIHADQGIIQPLFISFFAILITAAMEITQIMNT